MIQTGKVVEVSDKDGRVALTVKSEGESIADVTLVQLGSDTMPLATGDRVLLMPLDSAEGEYVALPMAQAVTIDVRLVSGRTIVLAEDPGNASPLAFRSDVRAIVDAIANAAIVGGDGGAAFKANILAALNSIPVGTRVVVAE